MLMHRACILIDLFSFDPVDVKGLWSLTASLLDIHLHRSMFEINKVLWVSYDYYLPYHVFSDVFKHQFLSIFFHVRATTVKSAFALLFRLSKGNGEYILHETAERLADTQKRPIDDHKPSQI